MAEPTFGQIPTAVILRLTELKRTEIIVLAYLYLRRNATKGQCNPSRAKIASDLGVAKPHVCVAIKGLKEKSWIVEEKKNFLLVIPRSKSSTDSVLNSVRNPYQNQDENVTESVPSNYETRTAHYIDRTEKEQRPAVADSFGSDHSRLFGHHKARIQNVSDPATQGFAIKAILANYSADDAILCYEYQVTELKCNGGWRDYVDWMTVKKRIPHWIKNQMSDFSTLPSAAERLAQNQLYRPLRKAPTVNNHAKGEVAAHV